MNFRPNFEFSPSACVIAERTFHPNPPESAHEILRKGLKSFGRSCSYQEPPISMEPVKFRHTLPALSASCPNLTKKNEESEQDDFVRTRSSDSCPAAIGGSKPTKAKVKRTFKSYHPCMLRIGRVSDQQLALFNDRKCFEFA